MNFDNVKKENFFVIDSDNLQVIESKFYGFAFYDNHIIFKQNFKPNMEFDGTGAYVLVSVDDSNIQISQDFNGSFGICFFENDNYFAISNSFLELINHIKNKFELSLNDDFAKAFLTAESNAFIYEDTLIDGMKILPRNSIININKLTKKVSFDEIDYEENSVFLNSAEGTAILDSWFDKWFNITKNIMGITSNISCDLTGGLDSRSIMSLLLGFNVDLNNFEVNSRIGKKEDFEIASKIAKDFDFKLNRRLNVELEPISSPKDYFNFSFYTKLGFYKHFHCFTSVPKQFVYHFTGFGDIRGYPNKSNINSALKYQSQVAKRYSEELADPIYAYLKENYIKLHNKFIDEDIIYLRNRMYKETRLRYLYGKNTVEKFLCGHIYLNPLMDPILHKLKINDENCEDALLLLITIYDRYCSKLLDYDIQGNRDFNPSTKEYARSINEKYPFEKTKYNLRDIPFKNNLSDTTQIKTITPKTMNCNDVYNFFKDVFSKSSFKNKFINYFPEDAYNYLFYHINENKKLVYLNGVITLMNVISAIEYSKERNCDTIMDWLGNFPDDSSSYESTQNIKLNGVIFDLPPKFWISSDTSISNGEIMLNFRVLNMQNDFQQEVKKYEDYLKKKNVNPIIESFNVNNIEIQKVSNPNSSTKRYWFTTNSSTFQIFTFSKSKFVDSNIKYLVNSIKIQNKLLIGNIMFLIPPKYEIKDSNSIFNEKNTIHFKCEIVNKNLNSIVLQYVDQLNEEKIKFIKEECMINNISIQKIKNFNSNTTTCWFIKDDILYEIVYDSIDDDESLTYLINNMI